LDLCYGLSPRHGFIGLPRPGFAHRPSFTGLCTFFTPFSVRTFTLPLLPRLSLCGLPTGLRTPHLVHTLFCTYAGPVSFRNSPFCSLFSVAPVRLVTGCTFSFAAIFHILPGHSFLRCILCRFWTATVHAFCLSFLVPQFCILLEIEPAVYKFQFDIMVHHRLFAFSLHTFGLDMTHTAISGRFLYGLLHTVATVPFSHFVAFITPAGPVAFPPGLPLPFLSYFLHAVWIWTTFSWVRYGPTLGLHTGLPRCLFLMRHTTYTTHLVIRHGPSFHPPRTILDAFTMHASRSSLTPWFLCTFCISAYFLPFLVAFFLHYSYI